MKHRLSEAELGSIGSAELYDDRSNELQNLSDRRTDVGLVNASIVLVQSSCSSQYGETEAN